MTRNLTINILLFACICFAFGCRSSASTSLEHALSEKSSPTPTIAFVPEANDQPEAEFVDLKTLLIGTWKQKNVEDCYCNPCLNIQFEKIDESFCVQFFQATVSAYYRLDEKNEKVNIYFKEPTDLGRGGLGLEWKKFDRRKPIAIIDISKAEENEISLKWLGFTYKKSDRRESRYGFQYEGVYQKVQ